MPDKPTFKDELKAKLAPLFETPQKTRITIICALVALGTLAAVIFYLVTYPRDPINIPPAQSEAVSAEPSESPAPDASAEPAETEAAPTQTVVGLVPTLTLEEAKELALADAGTSENEAEVSRESLTEDNGIWVYEFRFRTEEAQYQYLINANTGEVRSMIKEIFVYPSPDPTAPVMPGLPAESQPLETAPQSSVSIPPVSSAAPATQPPASAQPTASPSSSPAPSQSTSMYIGMDQAKSIALEHAGLSGSRVIYTHLGMGREDGRMVYEVEFRVNGTEYEYEIDASTGRIVDYEQDAH